MIRGLNIQTGIKVFVEEIKLFIMRVKYRWVDNSIRWIDRIEMNEPTAPFS